jgi:hypothetical protein
MQPFGWEQLTATLIFIAVLWLGFLLPNAPFPLLSIFYKSVLATLLFTILIYIFKSVPDFNQFVNFGLQKIKKWL